MEKDKKKDEVMLPAGMVEESTAQSFAEDFTRLYYSKMNLQQYQQIAQLYSPDARLVWNGESSTGKDSIQRFLTQLPRATHMILSLDVQRLQGNIENQKTFLIRSDGIVQFQDHGAKQFAQTFCITFIDGKYRIYVDNYRCCD